MFQTLRAVARVDRIVFQYANVGRKMRPVQDQGASCRLALTFDMNNSSAEIRALRAQSNLAIAARDAWRVVSLMESDVIVRVAGGPALRGVEASRLAFVDQFAERSFRGYERVADTVDVDAAALTATERGHWVGRWQAGTRLQEQRGSYVAVWTRTALGWRIRSETFVGAS